MGSSFLRRLVIVKQTSYGSAATDLATAINGIIPTGFKGDYHDMREFQDPGESEYNGMLVPIGRPIQVGDMAEVPFDGDLTFDNADYLFNSGWAKSLTGASSGSVYSRTYLTPDVGAINAPLIATVLAGDNTVQGLKGYAVSDCFIDSWDVGAARGGFTTASGTFLGHNLRVLAASAYGNITALRLGGASIPAWLWVHAIDNGGVAAGTTPITRTVIDWSLKVSSKYHHKTFQDGTVGPSTYGQGRPEVTLDYTFEQNTAALVEFANYQTNVERVINIKATNTDSRVISINLYGFWTAFDKPGDSDGNTTIKASFKCKYLTTSSNFFEIDTLSSAATLFA